MRQQQRAQSELEQTLGDLGSDHLPRFAFIKQGVTKHGVATWNTLDICKSIKTNQGQQRTYTNNPFDYDETVEEYKKRKLKQLQFLTENMLKGDEMDVVFLQEVDHFGFSHIKNFDDLQKRDFYKMDDDSHKHKTDLQKQQERDIIKAKWEINQKYKKAIQDAGWAFVRSQHTQQRNQSTGQYDRVANTKTLVTLYKKSSFQDPPTNSGSGVLLVEKTDSQGKTTKTNTGFEVELVSKKDSKRYKFTNMHLDYDYQGYDQLIEEYLQANQTVPAIMGGDANHTSKEGPRPIESLQTFGNCGVGGASSFDNPVLNGRQESGGKFELSDVDGFVIRGISAGWIGHKNQVFVERDRKIKFGTPESFIENSADYEDESESEGSPEFENIQTSIDKVIFSITQPQKLGALQNLRNFIDKTNVDFEQSVTLRDGNEITLGQFLDNPGNSFASNSIAVKPLTAQPSANPRNPTSVPLFTTQIKVNRKNIDVGTVLGNGLSNSLNHKTFQVLYAKEQASKVVESTIRVLSSKGITKQDVDYFIDIMRKITEQKLQKNPNSRGKDAGFSAWKQEFKDELQQRKLGNNPEEYLEKFQKISATIQKQAFGLLGTKEGRKFSVDGVGMRSWNVVSLYDENVKSVTR